MERKEEMREEKGQGRDFVTIQQMRYLMEVIDAGSISGAAERLTAMERVASFGSSSGCDFLTGFYFGLLDTNTTGGKRLEET